MRKFLIMALCSTAALWITACSTKTIPRAEQDYSAGQKLFSQQDYHAAFTRLIASGKQGNANAQYAVGYMLYNGIGVTRDQAAALSWLNRAAHKGNARALRALTKLDATAEKQVYHLP